VSDTAPPNLPPRKKLAVEQPLRSATLNSGRLLIYALVAVVLGGLAAYNALVQNLELTSPYVIAPAIGAVWFALRLVMIWSSNARG
jgi:sulfite exporter TauE/SafE